MMKSYFVRGREHATMRAPRRKQVSSLALQIAMLALGLGIRPNNTSKDRSHQRFRSLGMPKTFHPLRHQEGFSSLHPWNRSTNHIRIIQTNPSPSPNQPSKPNEPNATKYVVPGPFYIETCQRRLNLAHYLLHGQQWKRMDFRARTETQTLMETT